MHSFFSTRQLAIVVVASRCGTIELALPSTCYKRAIGSNKYLRTMNDTGRGSNHRALSFRHLEADIKFTLSSQAIAFRFDITPRLAVPGQRRPVVKAHTFKASA
jgi:hypothetical protein